MVLRARPLRRIARRLLQHYPFPFPARVAGRRIYVDTRSGVGLTLVAGQPFDPGAFAPVAAALRPGDTYVDVGANVGTYRVAEVTKDDVLSLIIMGKLPDDWEPRDAS